MHLCLVIIVSCSAPPNFFYSHQQLWLAVRFCPGVIIYGVEFVPTESDATTRRDVAPGVSNVA